jgi:hypothetical protein
MIRRIALFTLLLGVGGCVEFEFTLRDRQPATALPAPSTQLPPVTADQVTPENAREMAEALWNEFDREELEFDRHAIEHKKR